MTKKIDINPRPQVAASADTWVGRQAAPATGATKRLTVDIPIETHARFKAYCAIRQTKMASEINDFIERCLAESV